MAYRSNLDTRDKGGAIAAVVAIHVGLLFVLLNLSGNMEVPGTQARLKSELVLEDRKRRRI